MEIIYPQQFVQEVLKDTEGNSLISPESCFSLLSTIREGCDEVTRMILNQLCSHSSENHSKSLNLFDKQFWKKTKMFVREENPLRKEMKDNFENKYGCDVEEIDMKNDESARNIKEWIQGNVDLYCDFLQNPNINNILKMNFEWDQNIEVETSRQEFNPKNDIAYETDFINLKGTFGYLELQGCDAKLLEIPLSSENLKVILIIPNNKDALQDLERKLIIPYLDYQYLWQMQYYEMEISMPRFTLQQEHDLGHLLTRVHNPLLNQKVGMVDTYGLGAMKTITSMEVTERGIKAAALTGCQLLLHPIVKEMTYESNISNRFANTLVTSIVENVENIPQETGFIVILPEDAFITEFVIEIKGKKYKSHIKEKEVAKNIFDTAVARGQSAGRVSISARDSNKFTVSVNIEPLSEMTFLLTYEELLQRRHNQYELVLNIQPGRLVKVLKIQTKINETKKLKFVKTPAMRSGNEISYTEGTNPFSKIKILDSTAVVEFEPTLDNQKEITKMFGTDEKKGVSGQFVVQYDVELDPSNGEVLINDGYFVHFYAPDNLPPLEKHVIFALDTSGSMNGIKLQQLKDAMNSILNQIKTNDLIDILDFSTHVTFHDIDTAQPTIIRYDPEENYQEPFYKYEQINFSEAKLVNDEILTKAKQVVDNLRATSRTNIIGVLETALYLVKIRQKQFPEHQPMIIFLTDGHPNVGIYNTDMIEHIVTNLNHLHYKTPIFTLSFGEDADKNFLRNLSLGNFGFPRHIYEASDASLQLQKFYKEISSPLLSEVSFKYDTDVKQLTKTEFPIYFEGSHMVICGRLVNPEVLLSVNLFQKQELLKFKVAVEKSTTQIERLWAYLTVKQLLEQRERVDDKTELTKKALDLALKYSFVTEVTSLVVVKPEESSVVDTENASNPHSTFNHNFQFPNFKPTKDLINNKYNLQPQTVPFNVHSPNVGGGFGSSQSTSSTFGFGSSSRHVPQFTLFGSPSTATGSRSNNVPQSSLFGSTSTAAFGSSSPAVFGSSSKNLQQSFSFGATPTGNIGTGSNNVPQPSLFGSTSTPAAGASSNNLQQFSLFSSPATAASTNMPQFASFGSTSASVFGSSSNNAPQSSFGSISTAPFGSNATNMPQISSFGSTSTSVFGSNNVPQPSFGSTSTAQTTLFGSTSTPVCGPNNAPQSLPLFGSSTNNVPQSSFGSSSTAPFGSNSTNMPQISSFGSTSTPVFGSNNAPQSSFGSTSTDQMTLFGSTCTPVFGSSSNNVPQSSFGSSSTAPLGSNSNNPPQTTLFGSTSTPVCGSNNAPQSSFGSTSTVQTTLFGSTSTPVFGLTSHNVPQSAITFGPSSGNFQTFAFGIPPTTNVTVPQQSVSFGTQSNPLGIPILGFSCHSDDNLPAGKVAVRGTLIDGRAFQFSSDVPANTVVGFSCFENKNGQSSESVNTSVSSSNETVGENQIQVDQKKEKSGPTKLVIDQPFLIMVKLKLDNKYIISFRGGVEKPTFNQ